MTPSDVAGMPERGATMRRLGVGFFDNPSYRPENFGPNTDEAFDDWSRAVLAWGAGWLAEDRGRDAAMQRLLAVRLW